MSNNQNDEAVRLAEAFKALSHPNRLRIFLRLISCCTDGASPRSEADMRACVGEIGKELDIGAPTVSHHIKELRQAGLIRVERRGQAMDCSVDRDMVKVLARVFGEWAAACCPDSICSSETRKA